MVTQSDDTSSISNGNMPSVFGGVWGFLHRILFYILSYGPMPTHIAFIMDGNRRFTKSRNMKQVSGHRVGYSTLMSTLQHCYEMGIKYVTVYAFSIDNFKRKPEEVEDVMNLMLEKIEEFLMKESIVSKYGVRVNFWGNLRLLKEPVRLAAEKAMTATAGNSGPVLSICVAYTSTDEILHAVKGSCMERINKRNSNGCCYDDRDKDNISVHDIEKHLYMAGCPDPDIIVRTSGETRLSNFLLWQTTFCHLQNPAALWPEFSPRHLIWSILEYQRVHPYLEKIRKGV